jgi:hypothetical protein
MFRFFRYYFMERSNYKPFRPILLLIVWVWIGTFFYFPWTAPVQAQDVSRFPGAFLGAEDGFQTAIFYSGEVQGNFLPCG